MMEPGAADSQRAEIVQRVEALVAWRVSGIEPVEPGLDVRRFYRVRLQGDQAPPSLIARIDPEPAAESDLEPVRSLFARHGLPVPGRHGGAPGIELLEDLGDQNLETLAASAGEDRRRELYAEACALVPRIQALPAPFERALDHALIASKARKWIEWVLPLALGGNASPAEESVVTRAFDFVAGVCERAPQRLAHRDFKAANLILRPPSPERAEALCMIDLQGAFAAPPEYDLVCLLRDSQVPLTEAFVRARLDAIRPALPGAPEAGEFARRFDLITVVRVAKDIAHYVHAAHARGDRRYLPFVPQGLVQLKTAAQRAGARDPALLAFAELVDPLPERIEIPRAPGEQRGAPCEP